MRAASAIPGHEKLRTLHPGEIAGEVHDGVLDHHLHGEDVRIPREPERELLGRRDATQVVTRDHAHPHLVDRRRLELLVLLDRPRQSVVETGGHAALDDAAESFDDRELFRLHFVETREDPDEDQENRYGSKSVTAHQGLVLPCFASLNPSVSRRIRSESDGRMIVVWSSKNVRYASRVRVNS